MDDNTSWTPSPNDNKLELTDKNLITIQSSAITNQQSLKILNSIGQAVYNSTFSI